MNLKRILDNKEDYSFLKHKRKLVSDIAHAVEQAQSKERKPIESTRDGPDCSLPNHLLNQAHTFGEVYCRPYPAKFTAKGDGLSKGFVNKVATFKVEARDRYGRRSVMSGNMIKVHVQGPSHTIVQAHIEETSKGEYEVSFVPTIVGYHLVRITADGVKITNSESHVIVFNFKDYASLDKPRQHIPKLNLVTEPPVANMRSVCMLPSGMVVFTDAFCLRIVNPVTEELVQTIGSFGTANGQFSLPLGLAVNKMGHIFVSDSTNHRIQRFTSDGRHTLTFATQGSKAGCLNFPEGLAVLGDDKLYVADCGNDRIQMFSQRNGKPVGGFGRKGTNAGQFVSPRYIAIDTRNSRILVSDTGNYRIQALTLDGRPLTQFGHPKGGSVYLSYPYSLTVDEDGFILVTETKLHKVTVLTPRGAVVRHIGTQGNAPGQFQTPYGICLNPIKRQVIVTDSTSHCIQIY
jgi:DNA-binding beta-propeller fold protein YncE